MMNVVPIPIGIEFVEVLKECNSTKFVFQKLDYMHKTPGSKKWQLVNDFTDDLYSSASYYEKGIKQYDNLLHVNEVLL
jgi:hypothetical protein